MFKLMSKKIFTNFIRSKLDYDFTFCFVEGAHILSQEKDGCILYTWDDVTDWSEVKLHKIMILQFLTR